MYYLLDCADSCGDTFLKELSLFTGIGGGLIASRLLGWNTVCAVEIDDFCRKILRCRQADGCLEQFPIYEDVKTFTIDTLREAVNLGKGDLEPVVDIVTGGFP